MPSIRPQSERRGIWNRSAASPATLKIAARLPASGEIDARAGGELVETRGLAIVLRQPATALFPKDPEIELSVSVALVGGEFVEAHEALQASAAAARKPARWPPPGRGRGSRGAAATGSPLRRSRQRRHRSVGIKMRSGFSRRFLDCGFAEEPGKTIASPEYRDATMVGNRSAPRAIQE